MPRPYQRAKRQSAISLAAHVAPTDARHVIRKLAWLRKRYPASERTEMVKFIRRTIAMGLMRRYGWSGLAKRNRIIDITLRIVQSMHSQSSASPAESKRLVADMEKAFAELQKKWEKKGLKRIWKIFLWQKKCQLQRIF